MVLPHRLLGDLFQVGLAVILADDAVILDDGNSLQHVHIPPAFMDISVDYTASRSCSAAAVVRCHFVATFHLWFAIVGTLKLPEFWRSIVSLTAQDAGSLRKELP